MTTIPQSLRPIGVVTPSERLDPSPGVPGDPHHLRGALALAKESKDLVVAAQDRISGLAVAAFQLCRVQVLLKR